MTTLYRKSIKIYARCRLYFYIIFLCSTIACTKTNLDVPQKTTPPPEVKQTSLSQYNEYLLMMNEYQRHQFLQLLNDADREQFLILHNLDLHKYLNTNLHLGMSSQQVSGLLGQPLIQETTLVANHRQTCWVYCSFQGHRSWRYNIKFDQDFLICWEVLNE